MVNATSSGDSRDIRYGMGYKQNVWSDAQRSKSKAGGVMRCVLNLPHMFLNLFSSHELMACGLVKLLRLRRPLKSIAEFKDVSVLFTFVWARAPH